MARSLEQQLILACSPAALLDVLTDPGFVEERHRLQGDVAVSCAVEERPGRVVHEVSCLEPARTLTGIDPRRREHAATRYDWDLQARACSWRYLGPHGDRVDLTGTLLVDGAGGTARLDASFRVAVHYPLVGRVIERRILAEIGAGLPHLEALLRELLAQR